MHIIQYAVRVKGTHRYLPRPQRRDGRGGSHLEPIDFSKPKGQRGVNPRYEEEMLIRTFANHKGAANLLTAWLQGGVGCTRYGSYDDYEEVTFPIAKPHRKRELMEIVELRLELSQP